MKLEIRENGEVIVILEGDRAFLNAYRATFKRMMHPRTSGNFDVVIDHDNEVVPASGDDAFVATTNEEEE